MTRIPTTIVAGYLGSGKTTLVRHLLERAVESKVRLAIVSNEFGDTGIDRALLDAGQDGFVELDGGCVCCRLSDALPVTLETLIHQVRPDRLVLELSGVALPGELVVQFWRPPLSDLVRDEVVVVVVDAERAAGDAPFDDTFEDQLGAADRVIVNKRDHVDDAGYARAVARIDAITGGRPTVGATFGRVDPTWVYGEADTPKDRDPHAEPHEHTHDQFVSRELSFADGIDDDTLMAELRSLEALRTKGFVRTTSGLRLVQGVGPRI
ncbi:MAG: GTP-binding protein, partial [Myxococcota bacterium]